MALQPRWVAFVLGDGGQGMTSGMKGLDEEEACCLDQTRDVPKGDAEQRLLTSLRGAGKRVEVAASASVTFDKREQEHREAASSHGVRVSLPLLG